MSNHEEDKVELTANKATMKMIASIMGILVLVLGVANVFYNLVSRVAALETKTEILTEALKNAQTSTDKYKELATSIDSRLSKLEGYLRGSNTIQN